MITSRNGFTGSVDEGLEDVGRDRELHLGEVGDERRPAGGCAPTVSVFM
jgi:hypothetical protein